MLGPVSLDTIPTPAALRGARQGIEVAWARDTAEVREAQRLRHEVFANELGARLQTPVPHHDIDRYDDFCEHLLVREAAGGEVIGTYRLLTPGQARRTGGTYCDNEFDLGPLAHLRPRMVELGRSCVHRDHRHGGVILALWTALAEFMIRNDLDTMIGCASIPMRDTEESTAGLAAASIWQQVRHTHLAGPAWQVAPHHPLPVEGLPVLEVEPPALIKGYLRLGAKVLGPPAWDAQFNTADLPMMMRMADLPPRYRRAASGG
ncbi:MAG: GNAT family N-acetyltransferase [Burkholderiales bacterium]|nr:GNAT family N-acetyltransferase [Burkholderiales bacterium]